MSALNSVLQLLQPPQAPPSDVPYDGLEYKWKMFVFRPALFKNEAILLAVCGVYILWYYLGGFISYGRAKRTYEPFDSMLKTNFTSVQKLVHSGPGQHLQFATGRRNALSLHGTLMLYPIHDLVGLIVRLGKPLVDPTADSSESLIWQLTLGRGEHGLQGDGLGVWAVADKGQMKQIRDQRWDLSFPKLHEHVKVPQTLQLFSEHSEISEMLLKTPNLGIAELMADHTAAKLLKYFLVTDQPARRPAKGALPPKFRSREIIISLNKPSSADEFAAAKAWLQVGFNVADYMAKMTPRQDVVKKLATTRRGVDGDLESAYAKEQAEDNPPEMTPEEKRLAKKKAERAQLSEKELKRLEELERKREMRKLQKKQGYKAQ